MAARSERRSKKKKAPAFRIKEALTMEIEKLPCFRLFCPTWFNREDFQEFINTYAAISPGLGHRLATWHVIGEPGEDSDVFLTYDHGVGSDWLEIPADIWVEISRVCQKASVGFAVIWLTNQEVIPESKEFSKE
jgi:hypothetical protein